MSLTFQFYNHSIHRTTCLSRKICTLRTSRLMLIARHWAMFQRALRDLDISVGLQLLWQSYLILYNQQTHISARKMLVRADIFYGFKIDSCVPNSNAFCTLFFRTMCAHSKNRRRSWHGCKRSSRRDSERIRRSCKVKQKRIPNRNWKTSGRYNIQISRRR